VWRLWEPTCHQVWGGGHGLGVTRLPYAATLLVQIITSPIRMLL
jgi:hypothetical protein